MIVKRFSCAALYFGLLLLSLVKVTSQSQRKRSIGGQELGRSKWPWFAILRAKLVTKGWFKSSYRMSFCGGALVTRHGILTAAHCFTNLGDEFGQAKNWKVRLGTAKMSYNKPTIGQQVLDIVGRIFHNDDLRQWEMNVDSIFLYPDYVNVSPFRDDIALIKLPHPVSKSTRVQPITLPLQTDQSFPPLGQMCVTKGWGCTASSEAREVQLPIYSPTLCSFHFNLSKSSTQFCAGYLNGNVSVCKGDSGSPLVCMSGSEYIIAGIVSFGSADNPESFPAVFTRVQSYLPWIRKVIAENT